MQSEFVRLQGNFLVMINDIVIIDFGEFKICFCWHKIYFEEPLISLHFLQW